MLWSFELIPPVPHNLWDRVWYSSLDNRLPPVEIDEYDCNCSTSTSYCLVTMNNNQNTFEINHFDPKRWPSAGINYNAPSELGQTFTHATLIFCEISVLFNRLKGPKNAGTSRYFLAKTHYYVYTLWRHAQKQKISTYCAKKPGIFMTLLLVNKYFMMQIVT